jgi:hypothetical protein
MSTCARLEIRDAGGGRVGRGLRFAPLGRQPRLPPGLRAFQLDPPLRDGDIVRHAADLDVEIALEERRVIGRALRPPGGEGLQVAHDARHRRGALARAGEVGLRLRERDRNPREGSRR